MAGHEEALGGVNAATRAPSNCFVVMGFGKKTDHETGRTLDLDATYEAIIKPAVVAEGLRCVRADEVLHSGVIDTPMYEALLHADLVIADISTGNVNAVYELGVRHALRPHATIIMSEDKGRLYFDLNHTSTFKYSHLGDDIGSREAVRAQAALRVLIRAALAPERPDSPVYTYLPKLRQPTLDSAAYERVIDEATQKEDALTDLLRRGNSALKLSRHEEAAAAFGAALKIKPGDPFLIQQSALATYKSKQPTVVAALSAGMDILNGLDPEHSNDPETLGIAGAICKRLWVERQERADLDRAIGFYQRGFFIRRDSYNGENLATCLDLRAELQKDDDDKFFDRMSAKKVRLAIIEELGGIIAQPSFADRSDRKWIHATLANCHFALAMEDAGLRHEASFLAEHPADWEIETYRSGKALALNRNP
jgi:tetratricopeptide (TPR) repeat protein